MNSWQDRRAVYLQRKRRAAKKARIRQALQGLEERNRERAARRKSLREMFQARLRALEEDFSLKVGSVQGFRGVVRSSAVENAS